MFFALAMIGSLVVAFARGRSLDDLVAKPFRLWPLALLGVFLHVVVDLRALSVILANHPTGLPLPIGGYLYLASFAFLIVFLVANRGHPGFLVLLVGLGLNLVEIALNGGQMPADPRQLASAGFLDAELREAAAGRWLPFGVIGPSTALPWLGDRIFMPLPFRQPVILSIGDLIIAVGCFLFCNAPLRRTPRFSSRRMGFRV